VIGRPCDSIKQRTVINDLTRFLKISAVSILLISLLSEIPSAIAKPIKHLAYEGFTVWIDCAIRGLIQFQYAIGADTGNFPRSQDFARYPTVPKKCRQKSTRSYGKGYGRGHMVPANHMDGSQTAILQTNHMTNILPQAHALNEGAWLATEEIIECYRDLEPLQVYGGVIWGRNTKNDRFEKSHGIKTPDYFWKVVVRSDGQALGWIFPNTAAPTYDLLDRYLVTLADLETRIKQTLPIEEWARRAIPTTSWPLPADCNKG
jgi:endonuclease G, mitochondrial